MVAQTGLLLKNDFRLLFRGLLASKRSMLLSSVLLSVLLVILHAASIAIFWQLSSEPSLEVQATAWAFFIFMMLGAAMANAIRLLFDHNDLDLLFASPIAPRAVLLSRILTIVLGALLSTSIFLLPLINGAALGLNSRYLAAYPAWIFLALISSAIGTSAALGLVRWLGPRRARTWVQIVGAVVGATVYLAFQSSHFIPDGQANWIWGYFKVLVFSPPGQLIARAGRGTGFDMIVLGAVAVVSTATSARLLARTFLAGVQDSVEQRKPKKAPARPYRLQSGVFRATFLKELRLIRRDPLLLSQVLPTIMYIAPGLLGFRSMDGLNILAPISVVIAVQFSLILTGVAVDGEEGLDLIRSSPLSELQLRKAKIVASMALPVALALLLCSAVAMTGRIALAGIAFTAALGTAAGCSWVRSSEIQPSPRRDLLKTRRGRWSARNLASGMLMLLSVATVTVFASDVMPLLGVLLLGVNALGVLACFVFFSPQEFSETPA